MFETFLFVFFVLLILVIALTFKDTYREIETSLYQFDLYFVIQAKIEFRSMICYVRLAQAFSSIPTPSPSPQTITPHLILVLLYA